MVRISKGETITFSDGFSFAFLGHSHKRTYANDNSPLIVHGRYGLAEVSEDRYDSIQVPESRAWQWRAYQFRLVEHAYDDWMKLVVEKK